MSAPECMRYERTLLGCSLSSGVALSMPMPRVLYVSTFMLPSGGWRSMLMGAYSLSGDHTMARAAMGRSVFWRSAMSQRGMKMILATAMTGNANPMSER